MRSTSSCGVPCLRRCQQIPRFDRCSASLLCCMAVHLLCTFTTRQMFTARPCASRVPVESTSESVVCGNSNDGHFLGPLASLVATGDAMPEAYASVGLIVTTRKNCLYSPLGVFDAFDNVSNGHIMRGVHVSTEGTKVLGGANGYIRFCSRRVRNDLN
jgi:hypothetical protein